MFGDSIDLLIDIRLSSYFGRYKKISGFEDDTSLLKESMWLM